MGDEVCALLAGGGYAEKVPCPAAGDAGARRASTWSRPPALPEVACTVWSNVFMTARLQQGRDAARARRRQRDRHDRDPARQGARRPGGRHRRLGGEARRAAVELGADEAVNYREEDFVAEQGHDGRADVILDIIGAEYLAANVEALATGGRLVVIGLQGGRRRELDLGMLLRQARRRCIAHHAAGAARRREGRDRARQSSTTSGRWSSDGAVRPVVHADGAAGARPPRRTGCMEAGDHIGKIAADRVAVRRHER